MSNIRINALANTASSSALDDYFPIDGAANNTRKLSAYSPTFGGNATVSGGTITGGATGLTLAAGGTNQSITLNPSGTGQIFANLATGGTVFQINNNNNLSLVLNRTGVANPGSGGITVTTGGDCSLRADASCFMRVNATSSPVDVFQAYGPGTTPVANTLVLRNGNTLLGTTTDSSNGRLQLATHTTSAGGIGFGTDTSLFRYAAGSLCLDGSGTDTIIQLKKSGIIRAEFGVDSGNSVYIRNSNSGSAAITIGTTQNVTTSQALGVGGGIQAGFKLDVTGATILRGNTYIASGSDLFLGNAYVAGAPAATGYVTLRDSTGTTYKVLVST